MNDPRVTLWLSAAYALFLLVHLLGRVAWRDLFVVWFVGQGSPVHLGLSYLFSRGVPVGDEEFPEGFPHYHCVEIGLLLVMIRWHWWGRVPKELGRLPEAAPGGSGHEPPNPSTHGEEGTEEGRS